MFPTHPDTVRAIGALDHQERLRKAQKARIAAGAQPRGGAALTMPTPSFRAAATWFGGLLALPQSAVRVRPSRKLAGG